MAGGIWAGTLVAGVACLLVAAVSRVRRARARREAAMRRLCKRLPKVELHAHLAGCARLATITELAGEIAAPGARARAALGKLTLDECFARFGAIHRALSTEAALKRVAAEVLADFAADGVRYLEIRTTPRALRDVDARGYVCAVLDSIGKFERDAGDRAMVVRLLLSIDRSGPIARADETVELAHTLRAERADARRLIVGVDLSGNPSKGRFVDFAPALARARAAGLPASVHCAEVEDHAEMDDVLAFRPARLGHALFLSAAHVEALRAAPIPIELCPTSNLTTLRRAHMREHPTAARWLLDDLRTTEAYPVSISTDDTGVFGTSASAELARVALELRLDPAHVAHLAARGLHDAFEPANSREMLTLRARCARDATIALALHAQELRGAWA